MKTVYGQKSGTSHSLGTSLKNAPLPKAQGAPPAWPPRLKHALPPLHPQRKLGLQQRHVLHFLGGQLAVELVLDRTRRRGMHALIEERGRALLERNRRAEQGGRVASLALDASPHGGQSRRENRRTG